MQSYEVMTACGADLMIDGLGDVRLGDLVLVDWDRRPDPGAWAARLIGDGEIRLMRAGQDDDARALGRVVRPVELLKR